MGGAWHQKLRTAVGQDPELAQAGASCPFLGGWLCAFTFDSRSYLLAESPSIHQCADRCWPFALKCRRRRPCHALSDDRPNLHEELVPISRSNRCTFDPRIAMLRL